MEEIQTDEQEPATSVHPSVTSEREAQKIRAYWKLEQKPPQPAQSSYGAGVAMLLWSIAFVLFPRFVPFPLWLTYIFHVLGFVALLMAILGLCIEAFKRR